MESQIGSAQAAPYQDPFYFLTTPEAHQSASSRERSQCAIPVCDVAFMQIGVQLSFDFLLMYRIDLKDHQNKGRSRCTEAAVCDCRVTFYEHQCQCISEIT